MSPRGWCPSLFTPMAAKDGLLVRVKPTAAQLSAAQLAGVAEAAAREGNGLIQLTSRANLQVRGLTASSAERFARVVLDLGLAASSAPAEEVRNVLSAPLAGADPAAHDVRPYAVALEMLLVADPACHALPPKFGFSVDGGGLACLPKIADIQVELHDDGALFFLAEAKLAHRCASTPAAVCQAARALLGVFLQEGGKRMRHLVDRLGAARIFASAGLATSPFVPSSPRPLPLGFTVYAPQDCHPGRSEAESRDPLIRAHEAMDPGQPLRGFRDDSLGLGCFVAALPEGRAEAPTLIALAGAAERHGNGRLATTPWRAFVLPRVTDPEPLAALCATAGFIVDPSDPRAQTLEPVAELLA
jgi:precorrin-3B synthase